MFSKMLSLSVLFCLAFFVLNVSSLFWSMFSSCDLKALGNYTCALNCALGNYTSVTSEFNIFVKHQKN